MYYWCHNNAISRSCLYIGLFFFSFYHAGVILHLPCVSETSRLVSSVACSNDSFELFLTSLLFFRMVCLKFYFISASEKEHQRPCMHLMSSEHVTLQNEGRDICDALVLFFFNTCLVTTLTKVLVLWGKLDEIRRVRVFESIPMSKECCVKPMSVNHLCAHFFFFFFIISS